MTDRIANCEDLGHLFESCTCNRRRCRRINCIDCGYITERGNENGVTG